jgi:D-amino-acid dehydrogenase
MDVAIVGGGAIGLSSAFSLARAGASVTLIERDKLGHGCSYANAGLVVPSYSVPLANLQSLLSGLRWMFQKPAPFTIKARINPELLLWLMRFVLACDPKRVKKSSEAMRSITMAGHSQFVELVKQGGEFGFGQSGWLYLYHTKEVLQKANKLAERLARLGIAADALNRVEAKRLEPQLSEHVLGAVYYANDAHLSPFRFISHLADRVRGLGVRILEGEAVHEFETAGDRVVAAHTRRGKYAADHFVIAGGSWTPAVMKRIIGSVPIQPARGFSLTFAPEHDAPTLPLMLGEAHVIARGVDGRMRLTGGLELAGFDQRPSTELLGRIRAAVGGYLNFGVASEGELWFGYRPLTPDSLPIIGPTRRYPNLYLASGHGTLGMTLSLITGELIMQMITGRDPSVEVSPFSPTRFGL